MRCRKDNSVRQAFMPGFVSQWTVFHSSSSSSFISYCSLYFPVLTSKFMQHLHARHFKHHTLVPFTYPLSDVLFWREKWQNFMTFRLFFGLSTLNYMPCRIKVKNSLPRYPFWECCFLFFFVDEQPIVCLFISLFPLVWNRLSV